jgi:hypothetical protein
MENFSTVYNKMWTKIFPWKIKKIQNFSFILTVKFPDRTILSIVQSVKMLFYDR